MKQENSLENQLYKMGLLFLFFSTIGIFIYFRVILPNFRMVPCFLLEVLGIYCPGCGGTRAVIALTQGKFLLSLWYHPLVLYAIVIFGGFMVTHTLERWKLFAVRGWKFHSWYLYGALVLLGINFVVKNILLHCFHITI